MADNVGGNLLGQVATAAMDTRVILGALLGWSLVSKVPISTLSTAGAVLFPK